LRRRYGQHDFSLHADNHTSQELHKKLMYAHSEIKKIGMAMSSLPLNMKKRICIQF
jgi:hypothetical protein